AVDAITRDRGSTVRGRGAPREGDGRVAPGCAVQGRRAGSGGRCGGSSCEFVRARAFADRVECGDLVVVGGAVVEPGVGPGRDVAGRGEKSHVAVVGAAVDAVPRDGRAAVRCRGAPAKRDGTVGTGRGVERRRPRRGQSHRRGGEFVGAWASADGVGGGDFVV